ncbi:Na(+)/H(+) antiporter NhaA [Sphingorhabdus lutea]|uniref:Na(+)/H(+) antiporter NhaA n=1 Tax=Sphingorhabdus lutea TaxID=1913578 RepID=A0A1L3J9P3_9SPHN|nr:Na+/H+ antiporter NhaA [Sphingorhabdus lutea]APG61831.1 Na(+)/H(+) antiporter NhaA [Sphingorhabdus lutea]
MGAQNNNERKNVSALRDFLQSEAAGGILLMLAAALAMIVANSSWSHYYHDILHDPIGPTLTDKLGPMTIHLWINDGLMAIFFFLVGLEIKREFIDGRLSSWEKRRLPIVAAAAGMVFPAIIYLVIAGGDPVLQNGWAIPAATDIAFAIGVLALLGSRAPTSLKLFLVTVAIVDDMGAVAIIALVYTPSLKTIWLLGSGIVLGAMYLLNKSGNRNIPIYLILSVILWYAVLQSGVHATIAGVLAALMIPIIVTPGAPDSPDSPLHKLEHAIHPWSAYFIIPIFGFANAGVEIGGLTMEQIFAPVPLGIAAGLFLGKQIGIFGAVWVSVKTGFAGKLRGATWLQIYGVAMLCGIGFTMSLFIGELAFTGKDEAAALLREEAKIGILMGSVISALAGFLLLRFAPQHARQEEIEQEAQQEISGDGDVASLSERG